jgi:glycosyltransferase involved in cell wall biosynthesis
MAQYRGLVHRAKTVLDEVDVFSLTAYYNYWNERRWWWRWYDLLEWLRLQALEIHYAHAYDAVLTRSEKDKYFLKSYLPHQRIEVLSPWFEGLDELGDIPITRPPGNTLLFMGTMNLEPNVEAVLYFCQKVLPLVRARVPDATLYIIGSSPAPVIQRLGFEKGIVVTGEVESLRPFYEMCVVNVVPLLTGGGIIVKTLNGMAAGRPTVATSLGSAGVEAVPGREIIIADTPERMAHAIVELLTCENLWYSLAHGGRRFVQAKYNWEKAMDNLENLYSSLLTAEDKNRFAC